MGSRLTFPASALAAAGIVGEWEVVGESPSMTIDRSAAEFLFGDEEVSETCVSLEDIIALVPAENRSAAREYCWKVREEGGPLVFEADLAGRGGGPRRMQVRGAFGWDESGRMIGRGVFIDTTNHMGPVFKPALAAPAKAVQPSPAIPPSDPLAEAAERSIEVRTALGRSGHGALRLAADLLLWEINTALAARHTVSDKAVPSLSKPFR